MKYKLWAWLVVSLLCGLALAACTIPLLRATSETVSLSKRQGIEPTLPHAAGVLMHYCAENQCDVRLIDPATGDAFAGYSPFAVGGALFQVAPDRRTLAVIDYGKSQEWSHGALNFVNLQQWQLVTTTVTVGKLLTPPLFSPDGQMLALAFQEYTWPPGERVQLVDVTHREVRIEQALSFGVRQMRFSDDGQWLFLYGVDGSRDYTVNPQTHVALVRVEDLQIVWQSGLPDVRHGFFNTNAEASPHTDIANTILWEPAVVFAPTGAQLYIVHADENVLTTVDFMAHTVYRTPIGAKSWLERLLAVTARTAKAKVFNGALKQAAIDPTGHYLYVTGAQHEYKEGQYSETGLGVQVIDLTRKVEFAYINSTARALSLSPDGTHLYLHGWGNDPTAAFTQEWTEIVDTGTFQSVARLTDRALTVGQRLDGRPILLSMITRPDGQWEAAALDPVSLAAIHTWRSQSTAEWGWFVTP